MHRPKFLRLGRILARVPAPSPYAQHKAKEQNMAHIDEAAVLSHGKALSAQDGFTWDIDFSVPSEARTRFRGLRFLGEARRQEYLARARAELLQESDDT